jgi:hypothetical protein
VAHHALCRVIEPIWEGRFIQDSYANRLGKGTHRALDRAQEFTARHPYVLQCDVRQFFPSIDHAILYKTLAHYIADQNVMWLVDRILKSGMGVLADEYKMQWFPQDDLFAVNRPRGLPIGNLTSQFWANVYLNNFDQFVKREMQCSAYLRYVDDFLLFSDDKSTLHEWRQGIIHQMADLRLTLHEESAQIHPTSAGVPFLGFRLYPTHRLLKTRRAISYRRKVKYLAGMAIRDWTVFPRLNASIRGWVNHVMNGDTWGLRRSILSGVSL